ncbi:helix-turn-helix domain-containing protein [Anaerococcus sp. Marseille-P3915]|uniref:helix-turn-helix domain-containing protein n=1 Tax=Anaerococcus sp. Marseille-P3915 TaxID=2057799 RepID=UPI000D0ABF68|nr:helix-turn-helix transcriptional regulator [Anaerococcus sp. Marseille-P3915]
MNLINYKLGKVLKKIRKNNNISQEKLAELSFINVKTISNMENGKVDIDLDKLEILSEIFNVDLVEEYLYLLLDDSQQIDKLIDKLNSRDRYAGSSQTDEIKILTEIENTSTRKIIRDKARKLRLLFQSIELKNKNDKKSIIIKALNIAKTFDFIDLSSNAYDIIDYRLLINYAICLSNKDDRLAYLKFIENSKIDNNSLNSILYHNISNTYYTLDKSYLALYYINKSISANNKNPISPIMLYQKSIILYDLNMAYEKYVKLTLETSKKMSDKLYHLILDRYRKKAQNDKNFIITYK